MELGREWTFADARRIRLRDADDGVDHRRADARALARAGRDRRAARHVRIRAVIEIEEAALRAFEQDMLAVLDRVRDVATGITGVRAQLLAGAERVVDPLVDFGLARDGAAEVLDHRGEIVEVRGDL